MQDEMNKRFGANIIVGSCTVGYSDLELNMSILKDSIPPFKELADKENVNLFDLVQQNLFESIEYVHIASVNINSNEPKPNVEAVA